MIHKIIGYGSNGSQGVMDYMLKEKDKKTPRKGATVLRGDVETQAKLIDSLVGQFKQQYVTGVFSFEERPEEITEEQKQELMDGAEETIRAGLETDRVSITWIEHIDKGRLELNYIVACVDLKHGRVFQPYLHHQDQERFNAFKDIQNIKHGYTDPNDPSKAQNLAQSNNLPKDVAELKEVITQHIESLATQGLVNNRNDVKQTFVNLGYELARETNNSISVKRPDGGRNLKFTTAKDGGLYDINFRPNQTSEAEIREASENYRASEPERLKSAQRVYVRELERKREYHQKRHNKQPSPYHRRYNRNRRIDTDAVNDNRSERDNDYREDRKENKTVAKQLDSDCDSSFSDFNFGYIYRSNYNKIYRQTFDNHLSTRPNNGKNNILRSTLDDEQGAFRQSDASVRLSAKSNRDTRANDTTERQEYSSLATLVRTANKNAERATTTLASITRELEQFDKLIRKTSRTIKQQTDRTNTATADINRRIDDSRNDSTDASKTHAELSERVTRARNERERITEFTEFTDSNRGSTRRLEKTSRQYDRAIEHATKHIEDKQKKEVTQAYRPRMR